MGIQPISLDHARAVSDALDLGEREAIALAQVVHAELLLIDDSKGRLEARRLGLRVTGTLGVLKVAAERKLIDVKVVVKSLKATNFYVDDDLIRLVFWRVARLRRSAVPVRLLRREMRDSGDTHVSARHSLLVGLLGSLFRRPLPDIHQWHR